MPCMIAGASDGMAPAWLATSSAPPSVGIFSRPSHSARNQFRYMGSYGAGRLTHVLGAAPLVDVGDAVALEVVGVLVLDTHGQVRVLPGVVRPSTSTSSGATATAGRAFFRAPPAFLERELPFEPCGGGDMGTC